jgi:hypothetical protein
VWRLHKNNNNNNTKVILIKIIRFYFLWQYFLKYFEVHMKQFLSVNRKVHEGELSEETDLWHPDNNSDRSLKAESAQMRYLFERMTWDASAFSSEKGKCGVRGQ